jgi:hypothetical protein
MHHAAPLPLIRNVANLSPHVLHAFKVQDDATLRFFVAHLGERIDAANLCSSHEGRSYFGALNSRDDYEKLVRRLLETPDVLARADT